VPKSVAVKGDKIKRRAQKEQRKKFPKRSKQKE